MFHVGQKVICIDDRYHGILAPDAERRCWPNRPIKGLVYTVRAILFAGGEYLLLEELVNPILDWMPPYGRCEGGFASCKFRPLVERKTDISVFRKMLITKKEKV